MTHVPAYRFCVGEALRHKRRFLSTTTKPAPRWKHCLALADAAFHACYLDFYGVLRRDALVMGDDHLMNLLVAFVLASTGRSVLILDDQQNYDPPIVQRFTMRYPGMDSILCDALGITMEESTLEKTLANLCLGFVDEQGSPLVQQLEAANLIHDGDCPEISFWAEPASAPHNHLGIPTLRFWGKEKLDIFGTEVGKCPQYRAVFDSIILTSASQYSRLEGTKHTPLKLGDALKPLPLFGFYRASERLRELLDAIRTLKNGQNLPPANQHHA